MDVVQRMPKAELHLHLDGSLRPATALELARERGLEGVGDLAGIRARLVAPGRCADQAELIRAFDLPIAILQDTESLRRAAAELVEDVASDGTRYAEVRWAPALHCERGLGLDEVIAAVAAGVADGVAAVAAGRAEAATPAITVRLVVVAMRSHDPATSVRVAEAAARARDAGVIGFDLAGPEAAFPDPLTHARAFDVAREAGLGITIHAGEWGGAAQVRRALVVRPARIAHGAPAIDDPALVDELRARSITLDLCPTSNAQAAVVQDVAHHPLPRLLRAGVPVTLNTDDRTVSDVTLVDEYRTALGVLGLSVAELWAVDRHALLAAFLGDEEDLRARLLAAFDAFARSERIPALSRPGAGPDARVAPA